MAISANFESILTIVDSLEIKDQVRKYRAVQERKRESANNLNILRYIKRNDISGYREASLVDGTKIYATYNSNSKLKPDQIIPESIPGKIFSIDRKPAS